jgi:hypothetical protein
MGVYNYVDQQTGQAYNFTIKGDAPSDTEFARIRQVLETDRSETRARLEEQFGEGSVAEFDDGTALGRGFARGKKQFKEAIGETIGTIGEETGIGFLEDYGVGLEERARQELNELTLQQPKRMQSTDVEGFGSGLTFIGETFGEQIPQLGAGLGAAAATAIAAPTAPFVAGAAAAGAVTAPILFGNNIQRQEDEVAAGKKESVDVGAALAATFGQAALEGISDKILLGGVLRPLGKSIFTRTGIRAGTGAGSESLTEVGQQMLERAQAGLPIDSDDAIAEYREAAIAGGLVGGGVRTTVGAVGDTFAGARQERERAEQNLANILEEDTKVDDDTKVEEDTKVDDDTKVEKDTTADTTPTLITDEMLTELGVANRPKMPIRTKVVGKDISDPEAQKALRAYAKNAVVKKKDPKIGEKIEAFIRSAPANVEGAGRSVESGEPSVAGSGRVGGGVESAKKPTSSKDKGVGAGVSASTDTTDTTGTKSDTLTDDQKRILLILQRARARQLEESVQLVTPPEANSLVKAGLMSKEDALLNPMATARVTELLAEDPKAVLSRVGLKKTETKPETKETKTDTETAARIATTDADVSALGAEQGTELSATEKKAADDFVKEMQLQETAAEEEATAKRGAAFSPAERKAIRDFIDTRPEFAPLFEAKTPKKVKRVLLGQRAALIRDMYGLGEVPGVVRTQPNIPITGIEGVERVVNTKVEDTPQSREQAEKVKAAIQGETDIAQQEKQAVLNDQFEQDPKNRVGQLSKAEAQASKQYDAIGDGEPDTTTVADKQAVIDLKASKAKDRDNKANAAYIFFNKKRRPADALTIIGALKSQGTKFSEKKTEDTPQEEYLYYKDMTRDKARLASEWVKENMSKQAQDIVLDYEVAYGKSTISAFLSDKLDADIIATREKEAAATGPKQKPKEQTKQEFDLKEVKGEDTSVETFRRFRDGMFLEKPVASLDLRLLPDAIQALENNNLGVALRTLSATSPVKRVQQIAARLDRVVGTTKVQVLDSLEPTLGREAAGFFEPETNTIFINRNTGMNAHTLLHEMGHAVTSASLANKSSPTTKQLQTIFNTVREQIGEVYGTRNLDEFVSEALSNPQFQSALASIKVDGDRTSLWNKLRDTFKKILRRVLRLPPTSALTETDSIIDAIIAPAPEYRDAPRIPLITETKSGANKLLTNMVNVVPETTQNTLADFADIAYNENAKPVVRNFFLSLLPSNILSDMAKSKIPFAPELNILINEMSGLLRNKTDILNSLSNELFKWKKANPEQSKILNNLIPRSTFLRVDPSVDVSTYKNDRQRTAEHADLLALYNQLDPQGQKLYQQMRNYFQDTYNDVIAALETRLEATMPEGEARVSSMKRLAEVLQKESGVIRPYFPLTRKGDYRLSYTGPDLLNPQNRTGERYIEYYPTLRKAEQARDRASRVVVGEVGTTDFEISLASKPMDIERSPPPRFVMQIIDAVDLRKDKFANEQDYKEAMQAIIDLSLDAMPERSFMQSFRRRGNKRGFLGDITPTGMGDMEFDAFTMLKEKGRNLNRQLVQMQYAAKLENFRKKLAMPSKEGSKQSYLTDPVTAPIAGKMNQIAKFAQAPNIPRASQIVNSVGFGYTMGLNFSSAFITFFDVGMSSMPVLAGKYGIRNTTRAYGDAVRLFTKAPTKRTVMLPGADGTPTPQEINMGAAGKSSGNYGDALPDDMKKLFVDKAIDKATSQGQFNQSFTQEALEVGKDAPLETFNRYMSFMFHHSERFNRETTFIAAYLASARKALQEGKTLDADLADKLAQDAIDDTEFTLGGTAAAGRPTIAQTGVGNVAFLFKRFAISKYYMMLRLGRDAMKNMDPKERRAAQKGLAGFIGMSGILAGLGGMPLMGALGVLYNMFTDDDEDDFEAATRKLVGEGVYGGLANQILGVDLANRISMNSLIYRKPIIEKDQSNLWTLIEQLGGPVVGVALSAERGIKDISNGEVYRGIESMVPAAFRNAMKTARFGVEGATTRRGDPITEDINPYNIGMQFLGFAPNTYIQSLEFNKNNRRRQEAINSRRTKLLRQRNMARKEGDFAEVYEIDRLIEEFNVSLPSGASKSKITNETKKRSFASFGRTTLKMRGGMTYTPFMEESLNEFDQGFNLF